MTNNVERDVKQTVIILKTQVSYITFAEIDHEIISTIILPFCWFKKGSFQLPGKVCAQVLVNSLED